jgi:hypothetical protein
LLKKSANPCESCLTPFRKPVPITTPGWSLATPIRRKAPTIPAPIAASRAPGFALGYETALAGFIVLSRKNAEA